VSACHNQEPCAAAAPDELALTGGLLGWPWFYDLPSEVITAEGETGDGVGPMNSALADWHQILEVKFDAGDLLVS